MKNFKWVGDNILFVFTLFLLAFIPLYPKLPLLDVANTWVYIRAEDFIVVLVTLVWLALLFRRKITLQTPLTMPILLFWIIGGIATIHGVLLIFPAIANVFPNVAFLSLLRRIEYMSVFFISFTAMKDKRFLNYIIAVIVLTLLGVVVYGFGQKYLGFPAFLTMNEEFAKGIPIQLSALSRVPSTFAGHYDLAAYLVFIIPILTSLVFGFRNWLIKIILLGSIILGFILIFMTVSRVSFIVLLISLAVVILFQKKKLITYTLPVIAVVLVFIFLGFSTTLLQRFGNTVKEVDVLVDAKTGNALGQAKEVPSKYFENKVIMQDFALKDKLASSPATPASPSAIVPFYLLPSRVVLFVPTNIPTGENLPQGTGYINLSLSPVTKKLGEYFYEQQASSNATKSADVLIVHGNFLIKRASAYDLSFTTRFQGEWPHALVAFKRNILFGSGYGSISMAIDNSYLRMLGETGLLGFASFIAILVTLAIYVKKVLPEVDSPVAKSFVLGFGAGVFGLILNATLIDIFEASKIAFLLWLLTGVTVGILHLYQTKFIDLNVEFKKAIVSPLAIIVYLFIATVVVFSPMLSNYFVGDDFTWFRWAADCNNVGSCFLHYFTQADGFFYRPGTKVYFFLMYKLFWLNQNVYHMVSVLLHFTSAALLFLLAKKVLRNVLFGALAAFMFLIMSGYSEAIFWISSTGFLFTAVFSLASLFFFTLWEEKKRTIYFVASFVSLCLSLLFHELGLITPFLLVLYKLVYEETITLKFFKKFKYVLLFFPILPYFIIRFFAQSHWFSGDYNYNLIKLPFNFIGNLIGYFFLTFLGSSSLTFYEKLRTVSKEHIIFTLIATIAFVYIFVVVYQKIVRRLEIEERRIVVFGFFFFIIALLPFLGLGNIASRYSYLSAMGLVILIALLIKKIYSFLASNGKNIALASSCVIIAVFFLLHIIQIQQIHSDWYEAGEKSRRFFIAIDEVYSDYWATEPMKFYFVNVPIRVGEAWVFPVGLTDALWLTIRNPNIIVNQTQTVEQALNAVSGSENEKIFEFDENGTIR